MSKPKAEKPRQRARWSTSKTNSLYELCLFYDGEMVGQLWGMDRPGVEAVAAALNAACVTVPKARKP